MRVACVDVNMTEKTDGRKSRAKPTEAVLLRLMGSDAFGSRGAVTAYAAQWGISKQALSARLKRLKQRLAKEAQPETQAANNAGSST